MEQKYIDAVKSKNLVRVRLFLVNELLLDPRGNSFVEMKRYAEMHMDNLYDQDDSKSYSMNEEDWNEALMCSIKNDLDDNFSIEKLLMYEKIVRKVLKEKADCLINKENSKFAGVVSTPHSPKSFTNKQIYMGITVGSAAAAVTGLCLSRIALASLGFAGVVIGGVLLYNESKKSKK